MLGSLDSIVLQGKWKLVVGKPLQLKCGHEPLKARRSIRRVVLRFRPEDDKGLHKQSHAVRT